MASGKYNLRCIVYPKGKRFVGVCLDLSLFAEADLADEARAQIESQVMSYMSYMVENGAEDEMFPRKAPVKYWLIYTSIKTRKLVRGLLFDIKFDPEGYRREPLFAEVSSS
ncbi:MAG: hypothetical protein PVH29_01925 [Candidatus Zixiibacteriota bacterium]